MPGPGKRAIDLIRAIYGFTSYETGAIGTTKWPVAPSPPEDAILGSREAELKYNEEFFGELVSGGAAMLRHSQVGAASAQHIVVHLLRQSGMHTTPVLQLQREIVDQNLAIFHTADGRIVNAELASARRPHERELRSSRRICRVIYLELMLRTERSCGSSGHCPWSSWTSTGWTGRRWPRPCKTCTKTSRDFGRRVSRAWRNSFQGSS